MRLVILGSSSAGNCYLLQADSGETLILEAGVWVDKIEEALNFNLRQVVGCLLSHEHGDHSKSYYRMMRRGIDVYGSTGTHTVLMKFYSELHPRRSVGHRAKFIQSGKKYRIGESAFTVVPFDIRHDAAEPLGFLIHHPEMGLTLFLTDSYYSDYSFPPLNNILVEANYSTEILREKGLAKFRTDRIIQSHMSLETCCGLLEANDLSQVNNIVLIHLSDSNSNADGFRREVQRRTGKSVTIADAGVVIENFNKTPF